MKFRRAFNWGVIVGDADTEVPADLAHDGVGRGVNALALGVRHSSDVELDDFGPDDVVPSFEVDVEVIVGSPPHRGAIEHVIRVPSGSSASGMPKRRRRSMCDPVSSSSPSMSMTEHTPERCAYGSPRRHPTDRHLQIDSSRAFAVRGEPCLHGALPRAPRRRVAVADWLIQQPLASHRSTDQPSPARTT
jgi:hypothetical protein